MSRDLTVIRSVDAAMVKVEAAYLALTRAVDFQETRQIKNAAIAAAALAREAKDNRLLEKATELRTRAERKVGQMLTEAAKTGQRATKQSPKAKGKHVAKSDMLTAPTLPDLGITRDQSSKWQAAGKLSERDFETAVTATKAVTANISTAAVLKVVKSAAAPRVTANDDRVSPARPTVERSADQQVADVFDAVRTLAQTSATPARLKAALPYYQFNPMREAIGPALRLLQEISKWKQ